MDIAEDGGAFVKQPQGNCPDGDAPREVGGAVNGVDDPAPVAIGELVGALFSEEAVVGEGGCDRISNLLIRPSIAAGHQASIILCRGLHLTVFQQELCSHALSNLM